MPQRFEPKTEILPAAQRELWSQLAPAPLLSFVLYGGTAVGLHLGHRQSFDFDFFSAQPLDKQRLISAFNIFRNARTIQDAPDTLVIAPKLGDGAMRIAFFGAIGFGHVNAPMQTSDGVLLVASLEDLLATKLKAILDRAEAKDYTDIAAILRAGVSLRRGLGAFSAMFKSDPALPLRALGFFRDGDLPTLPRGLKDQLRAARDMISDIPEVPIRPGLID